MFTVTAQAAEKIKSAMPPDLPPEQAALRVAARTLPNGDIDYGMGFDEQREFDLEIAVQGINILIGASSRELLEGVTLDYVELEPGQFHFIFIPPQADDEASGEANAQGGERSA